jgi:hypothetical protein
MEFYLKRSEFLFGVSLVLYFVKIFSGSKNVFNIISAVRLGLGGFD